MRVIARTHLGRRLPVSSVDPISKEKRVIAPPRKLNGGINPKPQVSVESLPEVSQSPGIEITLTDGRFAILKPKRSRPEDCKIVLTKDKQVLLNFLKEVKLEDSDDAVSFDTETTGTWIFGNKDFRMVTLGVGHGMTAVSLDVRDQTHDQIRELLLDVKSVLIAYDLKFIAHNLNYDAAVISYYLGDVQGFDAEGWMPYKLCTYALFRYLSSEGFFGQLHSLKFAMKELMLWSDTNEAEQHDWLITNGYIKGKKGVHAADNRLTGTAERLAAVRAGIAEGKSYKPDKGMMYKVPHTILGKYNALDCYATYRLYRDVLLPAKRKHTVKFFDFWQSEVMLMTIRNAVDNYRQGIKIDLPILTEYKSYMDKRLLKVYKKFSRGKFRVPYQQIAAELFKKFIATKKPKSMYKMAKPLERKELKYTKSGYLTSASKHYLIKLRREEREGVAQKLTKSGIQYIGRVKLLKKMIKDGKIALNVGEKHWARKFLFNPGSVDHKIPYLFHGVEYSVVPSKYKDKPGRLRLKNGVEVDMSDTGRLPTGKSAITAVGGKKHILNIFNREIKKYQFVDNTYNKVINSTDGLLHVSYKVPGTNTQRLSGDGGLNLQNMVKDPDFLKAWQCRDPQREILCQIDIAAAEPRVYTEMSRDSSMLALYGPTAKPNDVYLFTGAMMGGALGKPFTDLGYDPLNPTKEAISTCKDQYKGLRNVAKTLLLSDDYGSGAYKKWQTLKIQGFDFTLAEVETMHNQLAEVYKGKRQFAEKLKKEWERNKGRVLDGFGFPVCVDREKTKDLPSRVVQKTAHMILQLWQYFVMQEIWSEGIPYYWHLMDFHDEFIMCVKIEDAPKVVDIYTRTLNKVNNEYLRGQVKIKADPQLATCLAEIKVEKYLYEPLKDVLDKANSLLSEN